jgi:competence protein ComEA
LTASKHIGPVTSKQIISERKKKRVQNWDDFITRVKGVGEKRAAEFSAAGLTVGGAAYTGPAATDTKAKTKADAKTSKKADKPVTEKAKDAAIATKDAVKGAAIATKDAVKETAKDAKEAVTSKKDAKKETKAEVKVEATKPAASAAKK